MIKTTIILGQDAVTRYKETGKLPSKEWLMENGGIVNEKEFHTQAQYDAYAEALSDSDGWNDYEIIRQSEMPNELSVAHSHNTLFAFIWNCNHMDRNVSDEEIIEVWANGLSCSKTNEEDDELYEVEKLTPNVLPSIKIIILFIVY